MFLLILLILFGTITMVNLFIAVIITDMEKLKTDVDMQIKVSTAESSVLVETLLPSGLLKSMRLEESNVYCVHELCRSDLLGKGSINYRR